MKFTYETMDRYGKTVVGEIECKDDIEAEYLLKQKGWFVSNIKPAKPTPPPIEIVGGSMHTKFKAIVIAIIAILFVFTITAICRGQEPVLVGIPTGIFQEVHIEHKGVVRHFNRNLGPNQQWGLWEEWPPFDMRDNAHTFRPQAVDQDEVKKILGPLNDWLVKRAKEVRVSGFYNFTSDPIHDWKKFGGDNYGTYSTKRVKLTNKAGYDFLDLSKWQLPIGKVEK